MNDRVDLNEEEIRGIVVVRTEGVILMSDEELRNELIKDEINIVISRKKLIEHGNFSISSVESKNHE